jgi:hypothetical protein
MIKRICLIVALGLFTLVTSAADTPEDIFWKSVSKSDVIEEYHLYLDQYPKGKYLSDAWRRIGALEALQKERANQSKPAPLIADRFRENGDGTVTDITTKLQWMRCPMGQTWTGSACQGDASRYKLEDAQQLRPSFAGNSDWRLPTIDELGSLVVCSSGAPSNWTKEGTGCRGDYQRPTIQTAAFPNTPSSYFWSDSPYFGSSSVAWVVYFSNGGAGGSSRSGYVFVRLVRGGK